MRNVIPSINDNRMLAEIAGRHAVACEIVKHITPDELVQWAIGFVEEQQNCTLSAMVYAKRFDGFEPLIVSMAKHVNLSQKFLRRIQKVRT